ncbi:hypothetical protein KIN20_013894 [Parelaphostrongylus tenuis]|uniref:Uncharacterized protein n=1 Tax=Parelaphostrongylus tenuis TaxID=148309 RepID=A0AAD5QLA5_PARTN|nr:hypothetical protein KIN20_013894 [Parelaphostrongylus tenuis]
MSIAAKAATICHRNRSTIAFDGDENRNDTAYTNGTQDQKYKRSSNMTLKFSGRMHFWSKINNETNMISVKCRSKQLIHGQMVKARCILVCLPGRARSSRRKTKTYKLRYPSIQPETTKTIRKQEQTIEKKRKSCKNDADQKVTGEIPLAVAEKGPHEKMEEHNYTGILMASTELVTV